MRRISASAYVHPFSSILPLSLHPRVPVSAFSSERIGIPFCDLPSEEQEGSRDSEEKHVVN